MAKTWTPHLRLSFGGSLGTPALEDWNCNVRFINTTDADFLPDRDSLVSHCEAAMGVLASWMNSTESRVGAAAKLLYVKLNAVGANGLQRDDDTVLSEGITAGGTATAALWHNTFALTHRTSAGRGRGSTGRIFPPAITLISGGDSPYLDAAGANMMATRWARTLSELNYVISGTFGGIPNAFRAAVVSPGDTTAGTSPVARIVTEVVCDRVPDVQHRRTRKVPRQEGNEVAVGSSAPAG